MDEPYVHEVILKRDKVDSFDRYPFSLQAVKSLDSIKLNSAVTFLIGDNGTGKSTLLEAIAVAWGFNPEGGSKNFQFKTRSSHSKLWEYIRLVKGVKRPRTGFFLRAESFYNVATEIENLDAAMCFGPPIIDAYGGKSLHEQSHGESFFNLVINRFAENGFYILDEPEAALSPSKQMSLITRINDLVKDNSQFIIATHSPIIMSYPKSKIYSLGEHGIDEIKYEESEHYIVTKNYLNNYNNMLKILLED